MYKPSGKNHEGMEAGGRRVNMVGLDLNPNLSHSDGEPAGLTTMTIPAMQPNSNGEKNTGISI
jgi:hypothetical protein